MHRQWAVGTARALFFLLLGLPLPGYSYEEAAEVARQGAGDLSRFHRTVRHLHTAAPDARAAFAAVALQALAEAHAEEAELAREEAQLTGQDGKLRGWAVAVDRYAQRLMQLREDALRSEAPVAFLLQGTEALGITVSDSTVILNHPRADQQIAFEQRILLDFCTVQDCEQVTPPGQGREPIPVSSSRVRPEWSFTATGPICAYRAIEVRFNSTSQLARSRLTCEQFLQEVMTLADEIAWQRRHAVLVEWDELALAATPRRPEHIVRLNRAGDSILVTAPVLYGSPGLLERMKPWLQERVENRANTVIVLQAAHYGWEKAVQ